jgi:hypothetical protein
VPVPYHPRPPVGGCGYQRVPLSPSHYVLIIPDGLVAVT